jgi:DNA-binding LytR/AlgR family response regulator
MTSYIIIDDEPIAHRIIENYCANLPHLKKVGNCYNAFEAMQLLNEQQVDLLFLDINMPELTGFDLLKTLSNPPKIIVTTAYEEYAIEGYELNISDYLLKPFSLERFMKAVNKTFLTESKQIIKKEIIDSNNLEHNFFIKGDKKHHQINTNDILYIEAYGNYTKVFFKNEVIVCHEKISHYETLLPSPNFLRVHKSFIVAKNKIKLIEGNQIWIEDYKIPIGRIYKTVVNKLL